VGEESLAYRPLAEVEKEVNGRVLADYLQSYEVIWVKSRWHFTAHNAGTLFESTRFPSTKRKLWKYSAPDFRPLKSAHHSLVDLKFRGSLFSDKTRLDLGSLFHPWTW
jgi:hypothetical protein